MIYPYLTYCVEVWGNAGQTRLESVLKLQKKVIRIIASAGYYAKSDPLFHKLDILKITDIYKLSVASFLFKFVKGKLPSIFNDIFIRSSDIATRVTRNKNKLALPLCRTDLYKKSIKYQGPFIWNMYEGVIDNKCSFHAFKKRLRQYIKCKST